MAEDVFVPWGDTERKIYRFNDGVRVRCADPMAILRRLNKVEGLAIETDMRLAAEEGDDFAEESSKAQQRISDATRQVFDVPDLESGGLTESELLALITHFSLFVGRLAESARPLPSSPPCTDSEASGRSTTEHSSGSGLTATALVGNAAT